MTFNLLYWGYLLKLFRFYSSIWKKDANSEFLDENLFEKITTKGRGTHVENFFVAVNSSK